MTIGQSERRHTVTNSNVTNIADKKPAPVATHTISYVLDGFPVTTQLETSASIQDVITRLRAIGAQPPQAQAPEPPKPAGIPTCPVHNSTMKPSQKPGAYFCPKKNEDGSYCRHKA